MIQFELPIKLVSEANVREHWSKKAKRAKEQRGLARMLTRGINLTWMFPYHVIITRYGPGSRKLDFDNLANSAKHVIDGIADALGVDDGDTTKITWEVKQERGPYKVRIEIK